MNMSMESLTFKLLPTSESLRHQCTHLDGHDAQHDQQDGKHDRQQAQEQHGHA